MASLSGLAQFVTTEVKSDVAVWYCVNSCYLNQPADRDTFRTHLPNMEALVKINKVLGYPIHPGVKAHYCRTKVLMSLLSKFKKMTTNEKKSFKNLFKGLYQNGIMINNFENISAKFKELEVCTAYIPIDGPASKDQVIKIRQMMPKITQELTVEELYFIGMKLDAQKSASDIYLDFNFKAPELPNSQITWHYGLEIDKSNVKVNPKTFRPFYYPQHKKGTTW